MSWWVTVYMAPTRYTQGVTADWGPFATQEQAADVVKGLSRRRGVTQVIISEGEEDE